MRLARIDCTPLRYKLVHPLRSAAGTIAERSGTRVCIVEASGAVGTGEALPLLASGTEDAETCSAALAALARALEGAKGDLDELIDRVDALAPGMPAARCALDTALHDLEGRLSGVRVATLLGRPRDSVPVNAVLGGGDVETARAGARLAVQRGYRTLKLKVGGARLAEDVERARAVRAEIGPDIRLRVDANCSWTREQASDAVTALDALDVELIEQPLAALDLDGLARLNAASPVPLAADESLALASGRHALLRGGLAAFAVLKPMVLGGLRSSLRLAHDARAAGVDAWVTTTFEGPVGTAAALHLACALGGAGHAHGLASADSLDADFPAALRPRAGVLSLPDAPGLGVEAER